MTLAMSATTDIVSDKSSRRGRQAHHLARAAIAAVICLVALNLADVVTTRVALHLAASNGRAVIETNPLARTLLPAGRVEVAKVVVIALLALNTVRRAPTLKVVCALWTTVGIYLTVIANNLLAIAAMK